MYGTVRFKVGVVTYSKFPFLMRNVTMMALFYFFYFRVVVVGMAGHLLNMQCGVVTCDSGDVTCDMRTGRCPARARHPALESLVQGEIL